MDVYRLTIEPLSAFRTPLQSDTIFGHLLWALRYTEGEGGEESLADFLGQYRAGEPPLLVSAGFPEGSLPVPVLPGPEPNKGVKVGDRIVEDALRKALEEERYLPIAQWRLLADDVSSQTLEKARHAAKEVLRIYRRQKTERATTRTAVDRITASGREGRLFVENETFYARNARLDVWHKLADESWLPRLERWWRWIERNGFGRRKSAGAGAFRITVPLHPAGDELPKAAQPNGYVTLSAWVPARDDPVDVHYRARVKRGKLGEAYATLNRPWKKPLLMLEPGAVAWPRDGKPIREWYGRLVEEMHWDKDEIVQYGLAFPLPISLSTEVA